MYIFQFYSQRNVLHKVIYWGWCYEQYHSDYWVSNLSSFTKILSIPFIVIFLFRFLVFFKPFIEYHLLVLICSSDWRERNGVPLKVEHNLAQLIVFSLQIIDIIDLPSVMAIAICLLWNINPKNFRYQQLPLHIMNNLVCDSLICRCTNGCSSPFIFWVTFCLFIFGYRHTNTRTLSVPRVISYILLVSAFMWNNKISEAISLVLWIPSYFKWYPTSNEERTTSNEVC